MAEHVDIEDAQRHPPMGASTATVGTYMRCTGTDTVDWETVSFDDLTDFPYTLPMDAIADSTATDVTDLVADFNTLLAALRTAGLLSS